MSTQAEGLQVWVNKSPFLVPCDCPKHSTCSEKRKPNCFSPELVSEQAFLLYPHDEKLPEF